MQFRNPILTFDRQTQKTILHTTATPSQFMNRIDRLFGILTMLQSRKFIPAEKIADKFDISVRTVYRDIKALIEQGVPVSFEQQRGYFIVQGYFLPPVSFSTEEANAFLLMERMVKGFADRSIQKHYTTAMNKVKAVLGSKQKEYLEHLDNNTVMQMPECFINDFEHLSMLQHAISARIVLEIGYKNRNEEVSRRRIEPIGLIFYAFSWHVICWCLLRGEYRDFKVSRIIQVRNLQLPFSKNDHISLNDYMKYIPVSY
jgi:predicted DNA-binding transcriptional regulator YafY